MRFFKKRLLQQVPTKPRALLRTIENPEGIRYGALIFLCPGCAELDLPSLNLLPVSYRKSYYRNEIDYWQISGDLKSPTLSPSLLEREINFDKTDIKICHSYVTNGYFHFLRDSTHSMAGMKVALPVLPDWVEVLENDFHI